MKKIRKLDKRISYCREFRGRVLEFTTACDANRINHDYYQYYINTYLLGKDPTTFLRELDSHIRLCEDYRKELVQEQNKKMLFRSYFLLAIVALFLMAFTTSTINTTLSTGYVIDVPPNHIEITEIAEPCFTNTTYEKIIFEEDNQIEQLIDALNQTICETEKFDNVQRNEVFKIADSLLTAITKAE